MIISDLNYLQSVTEETVIGGAHINLDVNKDLRARIAVDAAVNFNSNVNERFNKNASLVSVVNAKGNLANFTFDNEALGTDTITETTIAQLTVENQGSSQVGSVVSGVN